MTTLNGKNEKPDKSFFNFSMDFLKEKWRNTHASWQARDALYRRDYTVWQDTTRSSYRPSTPTSVVDHAADTQIVFEPTLHRDPSHPNNQQSVAWADNIEFMSKNMLNDASEQETQLPFKVMGKYLIHLGYSVLELGWDTQDREGPSKRVYNPLRVRAPHPSTILMDPDEKRPPLVIKMMKMPAWKLQNWTDVLAMPRKDGSDRVVQKFDVAKDTEKGNPFQIMNLEYLWTDHWGMLRKPDNQEPIFIIENTWGFIPFYQAFAGYGLGMTSVNLTSTNTEDGGLDNVLFQAAGLLTPIADTIVMEAQADSATHQTMVDNAYPQEGTNKGAAEVAQMRAKGQMLDGDKEDFWLLERPQLGAEFFRVSDKYKREISEGTYNRSLTGDRQQGVDTVGQQALSINAAAKKFLSPSVQMQHMASLLMADGLRMVDKTKSTIRLKGHSLSPSQLEEDFSVRVTFEDKDPVLQIQKRELGLREVGAGLKSKARYWRDDAGLENISEERDALDRDLVDAHPAVQEQRARRAGIAMGEDIDKAIKEVEEREASLEAQATARKSAATITGPAGTGGGGPRGPDSNTPVDINILRQGVSNEVQQQPRIPFGRQSA